MWNCLVLHNFTSFLKGETRVATIKSWKNQDNPCDFPLKGLDHVVYHISKLIITRPWRLFFLYSVARDYDSRLWPGRFNTVIVIATGRSFRTLRLTTSSVYLTSRSTLGWVNKAQWLKTPAKAYIPVHAFAFGRATKHTLPSQVENDSTIISVLKSRSLEAISDL